MFFRNGALQIFVTESFRKVMSCAGLAFHLRTDLAASTPFIDDTTATAVRAIAGRHLAARRAIE